MGILLNRPEIELGEELSTFKEFTSVLPPEMRGEALSNSDHIRTTHNHFASFDPFETAPGEEPPESKKKAAHHYVAYVVIQGNLYQIDGLKPVPINHGPCTDQSFPEKVVQIIQARIALFDPSQLDFALMIVREDKRIGLQAIVENNSVTAAERNQASVELNRLEDERVQQLRDNELQRHNYIGFILELCKHVVTKEKSSLDQLLNSARDKSRESRSHQKS